MKLDRSMNRRVLRLALPSILANVTVPLVGMADLAIAGHTGDASAIGAVAIATMLFDLLYWNMGFLRVGTGGFTAQAYGRRDFASAVRVFVQAVSTALSIALLILVFQRLYLWAAFSFIECSPEAEHLARIYFNVRIWAAPATLSIMAFKGWFIGMQNTVSPMVVDVTVNLVNIISSILFTVYTPLGFAGIAAGTLLAQYVGLFLASFIMIRYYGRLFRYIKIMSAVRLRYMKRFFAVNGDLFVRSLSLLAVYSGFTTLAADYGDVQLAVSTIMMKLMLLYSYFVDGFAYAGEALTGRYIGAGDRKSLISSSKVIFVWCLAIGVVSTFMYAVAGEHLFRIMTDDEVVISASGDYLFWLLVMPVMSCAAFTWDGIYIGASASGAIRNCMLWSVAGFFAAYFISRHFIYGVQALWLGFAMHLVVRTVYMSIFAGKYIYSRIQS